jgi:pilus assembly protein Flp/PilA
LLIGLALSNDWTVLTLPSSGSLTLPVDVSCVVAKWGRREVHMFLRFRKLADDRVGATGIEFALVASLIAVAAVTAMQSLGNNVNSMYAKVANEL